MVPDNTSVNQQLKGYPQVKLELCIDFCFDIVTCSSCSESTWLMDHTSGMDTTFTGYDSIGSSNSKFAVAVYFSA